MGVLYMHTLNPALQMPVGGGVDLTAGLGIWDLEFQILVRLSFISYAVKSKQLNLSLFSHLNKKGWGIFVLHFL